MIFSWERALGRPTWPHKVVHRCCNGCSLKESQWRMGVSGKQLEKRRRKAMELLDSGLSLNEVARRIGCNASSVMRWRNERRKNGEEGLRPKPVPGRPAKLTAQQKKRLVSHLLKGAMANGYRTNCGRPPGLPNSLNFTLELPTTPTISDVSWLLWAGATKSLKNAPSNEMSKPLKNGKSKSGPL